MASGALAKEHVKLSERVQIDSDGKDKFVEQCPAGEGVVEPGNFSVLGVPGARAQKREGDIDLAIPRTGHTGISSA